MVIVSMRFFPVGNGGLPGFFAGYRRQSTQSPKRQITISRGHTRVPRRWPPVSTPDSLAMRSNYGYRAFVFVSKGRTHAGCRYNWCRRRGAPERRRKPAEGPRLPVEGSGQADCEEACAFSLEGAARETAIKQDPSDPGLTPAKVVNRVRTRGTASAGRWRCSAKLISCHATNDGSSSRRPLPLVRAGAIRVISRRQ